MKIQTVIFIVILLLGIFLRIYNIPFRYSLGEETVRDAVIGIEGARQLQFPLTGSFSSLGPFTFGPWYAYQLIIATLVMRSNYSPWIYLTLASVLYLFIIYKIGEILRGRNFGLFLSLLAAVSPAQIISATHLTSHNMTNIFAILAIWIFLRLMTRENLSNWWNFALGFDLGIGINLHYQMSGLIILPILILLYKPKQYAQFITALIGILATFIPLFFFESNNHWFNTRNMVYYYLHGRNAIYVPNRWLFYVRDFWPAFWSDSLGIPNLIGSIIIILSCVTTSFLFLKKKLPFTIQLLLIAFFVNFVILRYYWGQRFFGYLNFLRPFVFIITALTFFSLAKVQYVKYLAYSTCIILVFLALSSSRNETIRDPFSATIYQQMDIVEQKIIGNKFAVYGCSKKYRGSYNSITFSAVFVLDTKRRIGPNGAKIGLTSLDCLYPSMSFNAKASSYPMLNDLGFVDFTNASDSALLKAGWKPVSFESIYTLNARWWFKEQP